MDAPIIPIPSPHATRISPKSRTAGELSAPSLALLYCAQTLAQASLTGHRGYTGCWRLTGVGGAMVRDHRPYWMLRVCEWVERWYLRRRVAPQLEALGAGAWVMRPWHLRVRGRHVAIGRNCHVIADSHRKVCFSTWAHGGHQGRIRLGDNVLVCPGCRFDSASEITVGDNCMLAAGCYVTDADWHDLYDRTRMIGVTKPVRLGANVWLGDGVIVCKGVTIGENSVVGAGSVVAGDLPANVVAAGNPARVVKRLDPDKPLVTRAALFADEVRLRAELDGLNRHILRGNSLLGWLRSKVAPRAGD